MLIARFDAFCHCYCSGGKTEYSTTHDGTVFCEISSQNILELPKSILMLDTKSRYLEISTCIPNNSELIS